MQRKINYYLRYTINYRCTDGDWGQHLPSHRHSEISLTSATAFTRPAIKWSGYAVPENKWHCYMAIFLEK